MKKLLLLLLLITLYSCQPQSKVKGMDFNEPHSVSGIRIINNQIILTGSNLHEIKNILVTGPSFNESFQIESSSNSSLVANPSTNISFTIGSIFDLIITDAFGASAYSITFSLPDSSVTAAKLSDMGAVSGQFLQWNGTTWIPVDLDGLTYAGNWNASLGTPPDTAPVGGDYYIVTVAGLTDLSGGEGTDEWLVGDWAVYNDILGRWERLNNTGGVNSFKGRVGDIIPSTNDYTWAQIDKSFARLVDLSDVNVPSDGDILIWNDTSSEWDVTSVESITLSTDITPNSVTTSDESGVVIGPYGAGASQTGQVQFQELDGTYSVSLRAPDSLNSDVVFTLPATAGLTNQVLVTDGTGVLSWTDSTGAGIGDFFSDGSSSMTGALDLIAGNSSTPAFIFGGDVDTGLFLPVTNTIAFSNSGVESVRIDSSGNVGIGTTTVNEKLVINGNMAILAEQELKFFDSDNTNYISLKSPTDASPDVTLTLPSTNGNSGQFLKTDGNGNLSWQDASTAGYDDLGSHIATANLDLDTYELVGNGGTEGISIDIDGNVTLDTTNQLRFNDLDASNYIAFRAPDTVTPNITFILPATVGANGQFLHSDGTGTLTWSDPIVVDNLGNHTATTNLDLSTFELVGNGSAEGISIASDGNVGIGETSPDVKLHVDGDIFIQGGDLWFGYDGASNNDGILFDDNSALGSNGVYTFSSDATDSTDYTLPTAAISAKGAYFSDNVGIGTTTPAAQLSVSGDIYANQICDESGTNCIDISNGWESGISISALDAADGTPANVVYVDNDGNVGIGTMTPGATLEVSGGGFFSENVGIGTTNPNYGVAIANDATNATDHSALGADFISHVTLDGSYTNFGTSSMARESVAAGVTNSGNLFGSWIEAYRNAIVGADDDGTLADLRGANISYGHDNYAPLETPVTTVAKGLSIEPHYITGTITDMYDLYIHTGVSGATVGAHYGVYVDGSNKNNYFAGNVGIGTVTPAAKLHVKGGLCVTDTDTCAGSTAGTIYATNTTVEAADYAEYFLAEEELEPGDIVGLNLKTGLARGYQEGDNLLGIVSTNPGIIGNSNIQDEFSVLVALMGQVPINKEQVQIEESRVSTFDNKTIGYLLASGRIYIQLNPDSETHKLKQDINTLRQENTAIKEVLCEIKPSSKICHNL